VSSENPVRFQQPYRSLALIPDREMEVSLGSYITLWGPINEILLVATK
jgi:hypothetical protein